MNLDNCNFTNCHTQYGTITNYGSNVRMNVDNCNFVNNNASICEKTKFEYCKLPNLNAPYTLQNIVNINPYTKSITIWPLKKNSLVLP